MKTRIRELRKARKRSREELACAVVLSVMGALFKVYYSIKF